MLSIDAIYPICICSLPHDQAEKHLVDGGELGQFMCKSETSSPTVGCKLPFNWGGSAYSECTAAEDPFGLVKTRKNK